MTENTLKIYCDYDKEINTYWADVTKNNFTCGRGHGNTEEEAISKACSDAFPYIKTQCGENVLFWLCLQWSKGVKEIKV